MYDLAKYNDKRTHRNTIQYKSVEQLAEILYTSRSTLTRVMNSEEYKPFITVDKSKKTITLNNDFTQQNSTNRAFVCLSFGEISMLVALNDLLLCKYLIYIKYYCGYSKSKNNNFCARQFLSACGYSTKSSYIQKLCEYNKILKEYNIIDISVYTDEEGHKRNIYKLRNDD